MRLCVKSGACLCSTGGSILQNGVEGDMVRKSCLRKLCLLLFQITEKSAKSVKILLLVQSVQSGDLMPEFMPKRCAAPHFLFDGKQTPLTHNVDASSTIPYEIRSGGTVFESAVYDESTEAGTKTPLTANITKEAWEDAKSGAYTASLTFMIQYTNPHAQP